MKKDFKRKLLLFLSFLLFAEIAAVSGYEVFSTISEYRAEEKSSEQLQQYINLDATQAAVIETEAQPPAPTTSMAPEESATQEVTEPETEPATEPVYYPTVDFESLLSLNQDVVGWIYVEDTKINYPIVRGDDNRHYVSTMVDGHDNAAGSIFMDYRNEPDFSDKHTVIYGHNMRNGSMFAGILDYQKPEFLETHRIGMILTPNGNFRFEVVGGYVASLSDSSWQLEFAAEDDFESWLADTMEHSTIDSGVTPEADDRIITLSTCSYEFSEARFVLVCRVME